MSRGPRLAVIVLVGLAVLFFAITTAGLPWWQALPIWAIVLSPVIVLVVRLLPRLLSPVLFYDALRSARQGRLFWLRILYALLLLGMIFWVYSTWFARRGQPFDPFAAGAIEREQMPHFAAEFTSTFLGLQFLVVLVLTPAYAAGAIAEEKEKRTLDFLMATSLTDSEIVLSKFGSRFGTLLLLLLTGLPVLALLQFFGGIDPELLLASFIATAMLMFNAAALSLLVSVCTRRPLDAVLKTYLFLVIGLAVLPCIPVVNFSHPVVALVLLGHGRSREEMLAVLMGEFTLVHGLLGLLFLSLAIAQLRSLALGNFELAAAVVKPSRAIVPPLPPAPFPPPWPPPKVLPPVGDDPLLWKEMYAEQEFRWERLHPLLGVLLLFGIVSTVAVGLTMVLVGLGTGRAEHLPMPMNVWFRVLGTTIAGVSFIVIAFYASGAVSRERERQTLDSLLTIPEDIEDILYAKWLGAVLSVRQILYLLAGVTGLAVLSGGLSFFAAPLVAIAWAVYAGFIASLGLFFSTTSTSTLRSTICTLVAILVLAVLPWIVIENMPVAPGQMWWHTLLLDGLTPPMPFIVLSVPLDLGYETVTRGTWTNFIAALTGLFCYAVAGLGLWWLAVRRLRAEAGPKPRRQVDAG